MQIQRIVCFKFKANTPDDAKQQHMQALADLQQHIPEILTYSGGFCISGDQGAAPQYDTMHYLTFASMDAVDVYFAHEAHQQFIKDHKHIWQDVLVLNAEYNPPG